MIKINKILLISLVIIVVAYASKTTQETVDTTALPDEQLLVAPAPTTSDSDQKKIVKIKGDLSKIPENVRQKIMQDAANSNGKTRFVYKLPATELADPVVDSSAPNQESVLKKPILDLRKRTSQETLDAN